MKCSVVHCEEDSRDQLAVIDDGNSRIMLCPIHQMEYATMRSHENKLEVYSSLNEHYSCEICGHEAIIYADQVELHLCHSHLVKLLQRRLSPAEYKLLVHKHGVFYLIRDELYVGGGYAVQPLRT